MSNLFSKIALGFAASLLLSLSASNALADGIVFAGSDPCFPAGVGRGCGPDRAPHILSIQGHPSAAGSVAFSAGGDVRTGDWQRGSNTRTITLAEAGITDPSGLRLFFDINEPLGQGQNPVLMNSLILTAYNNAGQAVFSASLVNSPLDLTQLGNGQGHSDYVFALDAEAVARLTAVFNPDLHIGLASSIINTQGGPESFFLGSAPAPSTAVPEPATMLLLGTGLASAAGAIRKKRKANKA